MRCCCLGLVEGRKKGKEGESKRRTGMGESQVEKGKAHFIQQSGHACAGFQLCGARSNQPLASAEVLAFAAALAPGQALRERAQQRSGSRVPGFQGHQSSRFQGWH